MDIKHELTTLGNGGTESGGGGELSKPPGLGGDGRESSGGGDSLDSDGAEVRSGLPAETAGIRAVSIRRTSAEAAAASLLVIMKQPEVQRAAAAFQIEQPCGGCRAGSGRSQLRDLWIGPDVCGQPACATGTSELVRYAAYAKNCCGAWCDRGAWTSPESPRNHATTTWL